MQLDVIDMQHKKTRGVEFADDGKVRINKAVLYYAVKAQSNNRRHGTASTKGRSEVCRTNKKVWRQKGTGNARHGPRSANIFVGGGNVFGPTPRSYHERLPKKARALAYREAFRHLAREGALRLLEGFSFDKPSTKIAAKFLKDAACARSLVIVPRDGSAAERSFRNLRDVRVISENNLNLLDLLKYDNVVMRAGYFDELRGRYGL